MGIKNLHHFLRKACPLIYTEIHLSKYAYQKVAVDTSIFMCRFKTTCGRQWLDAFLQLVMILRQHEVHPVFVYDTKCPIEKEEERKTRTMARLKTKEKADLVASSWEQYKSLYKDQPECFGLEGIIPLERDRMTSELREYLNKNYGDDVMECSVVVIDNAIDHMLTTLLSIRTEDFALTKTLFDILDVPYLDASGEAEATCAMLCRMGLVEAVLSEDTDVLNYKSPKFIHKLNMNRQSVIEIEYEDMLSRLEMSEAQFLDFCIMCGTDYNHNLYKIGPEKSFRLLKKYGSIEKIRIHENIDMSQFPYVRVREIFQDDQQITQAMKDAVRFCGVPNYQKLWEFCFQHNCRTDLSQLSNVMTINDRVEFMDEK